MKITKDQLRNLISEELEVFDKKASLLEQKEKIERSISLLNESISIGDLGKEWNAEYGENFRTEYSGLYKKLKNDFGDSFSLKDLEKEWNAVYGENFRTEYSGLYKKLKNYGSINEVMSGDNNEPEFKMKGTHLVEDEIEGDETETDEIWTKMEENWEALEEEWGEPKPSDDINSTEDMGGSEVTLGEPKPSDDIKGDLKEKMSEEDAKEIEESLSEQESLNEAMIKRKKLAGIYD